MFFVYVDEAGNRDPEVNGVDRCGNPIEKDWLYVLVGVAVHEMRWFKFEHFLNHGKLALADRIYRASGQRLELADTEIKSTAVRVPKVRAQHPFLSQLTDDELRELVDGYFAQLGYHAMRVFAVVVDKRLLHDYMTAERLHRKAYELLLERVDWFVATQHPNQRALMIVDNTSREMNRSLAMKHSYFQRQGTSGGRAINHIVELPMFVESNLSNGVQLADLCAYSTYRAFRDGDLDYPFFMRLAPFVYRAPQRPTRGTEGLKVFPDDSALVQLAQAWDAGRAK